MKGARVGWKAIVAIAAKNARMSWVVVIEEISSRCRPEQTKFHRVRQAG